MTAPPTTRTPEISRLGRFLWSVGPPVVRAGLRAGFSLEYERQGPVPRPPFVLASNHYSHFDPPSIGAVVGTPIRFLALDELTSVSRFLRVVLPAVGAVPVSRQRLSIAGVRTALEILDAGEAVGVFPEGIRVRNWGERELKRGAAWLAARAEVPLVPVAVIGTGRVFGVENRLHRAPIRVVVGGPLESRGRTPEQLTGEWADWIGDQLARFPESEVKPP